MQVPDQRNLQEIFERFARTVECAASPLYRELSTLIARDSELLCLLTTSKERQPIPNLFLGAVHYLLLQGKTHPLASFYATITADVRPAEAAFPHFKAFCLENRDPILKLLECRRVQTNEVGRCAFLLPAFELVRRRSGNRPLALLEVGSSAGLLLLCDHYFYKYSSGKTVGSQDSPVRIECELRGERHPPIPHTFPEVNERRGLDLHPVDLRNPDEALWLLALVWPDQPKRAERLRRAIELASSAPPIVVEGHANDALPRELSRRPRSCSLCVFHCHALNQFTLEEREEFARILAAGSDQGGIYRLSLESPDSCAQMTLSYFEGGKLAKEELLANYQPHGQWLEWLAP